LSNVIKKTGTAKSGVTPERFEMGEIEGNREAIVAPAHEEAERVLRKAREDAETIRDQAYQQGWEAGCREANERLEGEIRERLAEKYGEQVSQLVQSLKQVIGTLDSGREPLLKATRNDLLKLAVRIAQVIVKKEVQVPGEVAKLNLEECIRRSARHTELVALVSEQDLETLKAVVPEMEEIAGPESSVKLEADADIMPGGCLVRSQSGEVDATVETQLREVETVLLGEHGER